MDVVIYTCKEDITKFEREVLTMKDYYRFLFADTEEILEFDTEMWSYKKAELKARQWAKESGSTWKYLGIFTW